MPGIEDLYKDPRFAKVTDRTKTDIIGAIGININDAKQEVKESKYSQETLKLALHHVVATEAQNKNPNARALIYQGNASSFNIADHPFCFSGDDPWVMYWATNNIVSPNNYSGGGSSSCGGGDGEGVALLCMAACVCAAGCCCVHCMKETLNGPESTEVKTVKAGGSTVVGLAVFLWLFLYLSGNDIWRHSVVEKWQWDEEGYRLLLLFVAAFSGFLSSGAVSGVNNAWLCVPGQPQPSKEVLAALKDLEVIRTFLSQGWVRQGDDPVQCQAFIREVILRYIETIAEPALQEVKTEMPTERRPLISAASQMTVFRPQVPVPSAPPLAASHTQPSSDGGSYRRLPNG